MYRTVFSSRAQGAFQALPQRGAERVKEAILKLQGDPRTHGPIKLSHAPVGQYRYRVGNHRLLFDIDDDQGLILLLDIRQRDEGTYR
jgi:mRNA interferase RelE/StbE